jgi:protein-tyrosine phosphatase
LIDVHCHLLPALDDGARDLHDALTMAADAAADGVRAICATPHIRRDHAVDIGSLAGRRAALERAGAAVEVLQGGEVAQERVDALSDEELGSVTLGAGRWILLEPAPGPIGGELACAVEQLRERGFGAVVAHPERHAGPDLIEQLEALREAGALVQVTAAYVGEPWMRRLVSAGVVDLVGSDAHTSHGGRRPRLSGAAQTLRALGADWERIAYETPAAVVGRQRSAGRPRP